VLLSTPALVAHTVSAKAVPLPEQPTTRVIVLDNCDPIYKGKEHYEDNLSFLDGSGKTVARVSGLNNCEEIGSPHKIAVDRMRSLVWVAENVGHRLLQYDLKGKRLLALPGVPASALAVDPATGNVWVLRSTGSIGKGATEVYDLAGSRVAAYEFHGWDIAYDGKGKAFWLAEQQLLKVTPEGKVLFQKPIAQWCASSVAVDQKTGAVWVTTREYSARNGKNELLGFANDGQLLHTIPLGARTPFRVAVDSRDGTVWVTIFRGPVLRYTAQGQPDGEFPLQALAAEVDGATGDVWVVTQDETVKLNTKGKTLVKARHPQKTSQAWIASY
jgi:DNA-binding beta-propeller fold protein YncE